MEVNDIVMPEISASLRRYLALRLLVEQAVVILALPVLLPLCAIIAIAIRLDSSGPVLFRQPRPGLGNDIFIILKFRTMHVEQCDDGSLAARHADDRVTRVGRLLRISHLDELPQAWNVLRGEMSLIGPRPEPISQTVVFEAVHPEYCQRRCLLPGVTGWAQVRLGYTGDVEGAKKKLEYDLYYIQNISLRLDLSIVARTFVVMLTKRSL